MSALINSFIRLWIWYYICILMSIASFSSSSSHYYIIVLLLLLFAFAFLSYLFIFLSVFNSGGNCVAGECRWFNIETDIHKMLRGLNVSQMRSCKLCNVFSGVSYRQLLGQNNNKNLLLFYEIVLFLYLNIAQSNDKCSEYFLFNILRIMPTYYKHHKK